MRTALTILFLGAGIASLPLRGEEAPLLQSVRVITGDDHALPGQAELNAALNSHLGRHADEAELAQLADMVVEHLRQEHWPVTLVTVWDEDGGLAHGNVTLQVQQGTIGKIGVVGGSKRRQLAVARRVADLPGQPLDSLDLQRRLDALAFSPWLAVTPQASPAAGALGTADLMLTLEDQNPVQVFAAYENNGVEPLGENRYTVGLEWLDAFALGQDLTISGTVADDPDTLKMVSGYWRIPLPWRHELRLSGYYAESHSTTDLLGIPFDEDGITWVATVRYVVPWRLSDHWRSEWWIGYDYKQFNNEFVFGGTAASPIPVGVGTLVAGTSWYYEAGGNHARFGLEVAHGGEGWAENQTPHAYNDLAPGAEPDFTVVRSDAAFQHDFANDAQVSLRLGGQWADGVLLASEEIALASVYAVRGYPERSVLASRGAWASLEARTPEWEMLKSRVKFRGIAFADGGWNADDFDDDNNSDDDSDTTATRDTIASVGIGLRAEITSHFLFRCDVAFPLIDGEDDCRVHLAAVLKF
jgi:hemolysin activation/secretion protein